MVRTTPVRASNGRRGNGRYFRWILPVPGIFALRGRVCQGPAASFCGFLPGTFARTNLRYHTAHCPVTQGES